MAIKSNSTKNNKSSANSKSASSSSSKSMADSKIAVVDIQSLVNQTPSVQALRQERQSQMANLQQWINSANSEINQLTDQAAKSALFQKYQLELNQRQQMLRQDYAQKVQTIDAELSKLIADEAKAAGYDYVFAKGIVVFGGTDITEQVTKSLKK